MGAKTKVVKKAPAASVAPAIPPADDAVNDIALVDAPEVKETKAEPKGKAELEFPVVALIKKYDDKIPSQCADQAQLDRLIEVHGAENVEVQA